MGGFECPTQEGRDPPFGERARESGEQDEAGESDYERGRRRQHRRQTSFRVAPGSESHRHATGSAKGAEKDQPDERYADSTQVVGCNEPRCEHADTTADQHTDEAEYDGGGVAVVSLCRLHSRSVVAFRQRVVPLCQDS